MSSIVQQYTTNGTFSQLSDKLKGRKVSLLLINLTPIINKLVALNSHFIDQLQHLTKTLLKLIFS